MKSIMTGRQTDKTVRKEVDYNEYYNKNQTAKCLKWANPQRKWKSKYDQCYTASDKYVKQMGSWGQQTINWLCRSPRMFYNLQQFILISLVNNRDYKFMFEILLPHLKKKKNELCKNFLKYSSIKPKIIFFIFPKMYTRYKFFIFYYWVFVIVFLTGDKLVL